MPAVTIREGSSLDPASPRPPPRRAWRGSPRRPAGRTTAPGRGWRDRPGRCRRRPRRRGRLTTAPPPRVRASDAPTAPQLGGHQPPAGGAAPRTSMARDAVRGPRRGWSFRRPGPGRRRSTSSAPRSPTGRRLTRRTRIDAGTVDARLLLQPQLGEGDVGGDPVQPAGAGDREHGGLDVGGAATGGEQEVADPERQVETAVDVPLAWDTTVSSRRVAGQVAAAA